MLLIKLNYLHKLQDKKKYIYINDKNMTRIVNVIFCI